MGQPIVVWQNQNFAHLLISFIYHSKLFVLNEKVQ